MYFDGKAINAESFVCKSILNILAQEFFLTKINFMEQNQDTSLFGLSIDPTGKSHLSDTAKWAKFLAIVGMVMCILVVIFGIIAATSLSRVENDFQRQFGSRSNSFGAGFGITIMIMYIIIAVIYFFPCLFTLRFANHIQNALRANDLASLNEGFKNLKITFRYMGILTIIFIALFLFSLLIGGLGALTGN
jgi:amino acid transporter